MEEEHLRVLPAGATAEDVGPACLSAAPASGDQAPAAQAAAVAERDPDAGAADGSILAAVSSRRTDAAAMHATGTEPPQDS